MASSVKLGSTLFDKRENFDTGEIGTHRGEQLELGGCRISIRRDDDNTSLNGCGTIRQA
jgi:hypothetical protein